MNVFDALVLSMEKMEMVCNIGDVVFGLHGVDNNHFKLSVPDERIVLEAVEDPDDGYRSLLECVKKSDRGGLIFFDSPVVIGFEITGISAFRNYNLALTSESIHNEKEAETR